MPLGGTAFAVGSKQFASQPRCAPGAVRAVAIVTGQRIDLSGLTSSWTSNPSLFDYRWSCTGGGVLVRKAPDSTAAVDGEFAGNPSRVAIVSSAAGGIPYGGSVSRQPDGSFRVVFGGANDGTAPGAWQPQWNVPFVIVLL